MDSDSLRHYRKGRGLSQAQLADELDVSIHTVRSWEQGKNPIPKIVEKHLLSQVEAAIPVSLIVEINKRAHEKGETFDQALFAIIRAGLDAND